MPLLQAYTGDRLHLGAGGNLLPGWLNTDLYDSDPERNLPAVDVTQGLPFPDATFRFVFNEHLIEHITWEQGLALLREIRRVLVPGGVVRIATPDLAQLLTLTDDHWYVADSAARHPNVRGISAGHVINNFMRDWGHQFIYDRSTLRDLLDQAGFADVAERGVGESPYSELRGVEGHGNVVGAEVNAFETFVLEGTA